MPAGDESRPSRTAGPRRLTVHPIDAAAFAPYGSVIVPPSASVRLDRVATFADDRATATANVAVVRSPVAHLPLRVREMERHPHSDQIFIPLDARRYLVVVASNGADGRPVPDSLAAFAVPHPVGIRYSPQTWHINMACLGDAGSFCLLIHEGGTAEDCIFSPIEEFVIAMD